MEMLIGTLENERAGLREQMANKLQVQQEQLQNMMAASMKQAEREREAFIEENHASEERFLEMQKSNEENMEMIMNMTELITKHEEEKLELRRQMDAMPKGEVSASLRKMNDRHTQEVTALLEKMDIQLDGIKKITESSDEKALYSTMKGEILAGNPEELPQLMASRAQMVGNLQQRMAETEKERDAVEEPSFMSQVVKFMAQVASVAGKGVALYAGPFKIPIFMKRGLTVTEQVAPYYDEMLNKDFVAKAYQERKRQGLEVNSKSFYNMSLLLPSLLIHKILNTINIIILRSKLLIITRWSVARAFSSAPRKSESFRS